MWTEKRWRGFTPRLRKWMELWEETGRRHGLNSETGYLLGGEVPGIADIVTATLWSTLADRFQNIAVLLEEAAPRTSALSRRVSDLPALAELAASARKDYGDAYCGGEIGNSMKKVLNA
jgi:glutathione S-transferase